MSQNQAEWGRFDPEPMRRKIAEARERLEGAKQQAVKEAASNINALTEMLRNHLAQKGDKNRG